MTQNPWPLDGDAAIFQASPPLTLAAVAARVEADLSGTTRRDTLSALRTFERHLDRGLAEIPATGRVVADLLARLEARALGVSAARLTNIRSLVRTAVARFGAPRALVTRDIPPAPAWRALLDTMPRQDYRFGLSRLASYCTVKGLTPEDVSVDILPGFHAALEGDVQVTKPRNVLKHTIAIWNMCGKRVASWPRARLRSPFKQPAYMLPLTAFPAPFQADVAAWEARMTSPDVLDAKAPVRALRPATLQAYRYGFRRLASALVRTEKLSIEQVTGLDIFFDLEVLKAALRPFLPGDEEERDTGYAHKMAVQVGVVARYRCADPGVLEAIKALTARLTPKPAGGMGKRNRGRLRQFDDPEVVRRLLEFPEAELRRALRLSNPTRRAKGVERALATSILLLASLRVRNLRTLRLDRNIVRQGTRVLLRFGPEEMKMGAPHELALEPETVQLLDLFLGEHRGLLPGHAGPYLFPSPDGGPRSYSAMREATSKALRRHACITVSPHLYRHVIAKIVAETDPGLLPALARRLGHASLNTTYKSYLATETPAASRRVNQLLGEVQRGVGQ